MRQVINAGSLEEFQKHLIKQKDATSKAQKELNRAVDSIPLLYDADGSLSPSTTSEILKRTKELITHYAVLPTLSEFTRNPAQAAINKWGASFGVSSIIGTVILKTLMDSFPEFSTSVKPIFIKVLRELYMAHENNENNKEQSMMERVMENLNFSIRDKNGHDILGEKRDKVIRNRVALLLEVVAKVLEDYGMTMVEREDDQISSSITPLGIRVYLHIIDVDQYIQDVPTIYQALTAKG